MSDKKEITVKGWWWLPEHRDKKIPGIANLKLNSGAEVDLLDAFPHEGTGWDQLRHQSYPVIYGSSHDNKHVVLLDCYETQRQGPGTFPPTPFRKSTITARIALVGSPLPLLHRLPLIDNEPHFTEVTAEYEQLTEWCDIDRGVQDEHTKGQYRIEADYGAVPAIESEIGDGFTVSLNFFTHPVFPSLLHGRRGIEVGEYFQIKSETPRPIRAFERIIVRIQYMLTLFMNRPVNLERPYGVSKKIEIEGEEGSSKQFTVDAGGYSIYIRKAEDHKPIRSRHDMLISLEEIKEDLPDILRAWCAESGSQDPIYHVYFDRKFASKGYVEDLFAQYVQILEGYHRRITYDDHLVAKSSFRRVRKQVLEAIPDDVDVRLRENITSTIKFANIYSLRQRLLHLISRRSLEFQAKWFGTPEEIEVFARRVASTRDYLVHLLPKADVGPIFDDLDDLWYAKQDLELLVKASLLEKMGVKDEIIDRALEDYASFNMVPSPKRAKAKNGIPAKEDGTDLNGESSGPSIEGDE